ncbi:TonB-dependent receptor [Pedobacter borealis]|uniref:TonB-dependent receptor n=1 Tax=Pedobacter borealis TaxID=475254 RepID=UPI001428AA30|nr:TonB-dependent receptor [Pedobacter borealis]
MKLTILIMTVFLLQVSASTKAQITLNENKSSLHKVLKLISKQSGYDLIYSIDDLKGAKPVSIILNNESLEKVLQLCFAGQPLVYKVSDKTIMIKRKEEQVSSKKLAPIIITGKTLDEDGKPLAGTTIKIKGTDFGAVSDQLGNFTLPIPKNTSNILVFSYLGYELQEYVAKATETIAIVMVRKVMPMDELVIVGYGTQKKKDILGAVATIDSKDIAKVPNATSVADLLTGRLSGLNVVNRSGQPGKFDYDLITRGRSNGLAPGQLNAGSPGSPPSPFNNTNLNNFNFGNSMPLVLVDGIEGDMNLLNPQDIETITLLKDAAAAIYGIRAANGVLQITTKKGNKGKVTLDYQTNVGIQQMNTLPKFLPSWQQAVLVNESIDYEGIRNGGIFIGGGGFGLSSTPSRALHRFTDEEIQKYKDGSDPNYPNTDWVDLLYQKPGVQQQHNLNISGGDTNSTYRISFEYVNQDGNLQGTNSKRYGTRINLTSNPFKKLKIETGLNFSHAPAQESGGASGYVGEIFENAYHISPMVPVKFANGAYSSTNQISPLAWLNAGSFYKASSTTVNGTLGLTWTPIEDLVIKPFIGFNYGTNNYQTFGARLDSYFDGPAGSPWVVNPQYSQLTNFYIENVSSNIGITPQITASYQKILGNHLIGVLAGASESVGNSRYIFARKQNLLNNTLQSLDLASADQQTLQGSPSETVQRSAFGRVFYNYADRYYLESTLRGDATTVFSPDKQWGIFPSFAAGWIISNEYFFRDSPSLLKTFDFLKLRASWSKLGNNSIGNFAYLTRLTVGNYPFNNQLQPYLVPGLPGNPNIQWEKTTIRNIGLDAVMLKNKLSVTVELYDKRTNDILLTLLAPINYGYSSAPAENVGSMRNRGVEAIASYKDRIGEFIWSVKGNFSYNKNLITNYLLKTNSPTFTFQTENLEGYAYGSIFGLQSEGIYQTQDEVDKSAKFADPVIHQAPGDIKYKDQDGDGVITPKDVVYLGNSIASKNFGLGLSGSWKRIELNLFFSGSAGRKVNIGSALGSIGDWTNKASPAFWDRWTPTNPTNEFPRAWAYNTQNSPQAVSSDFWLRNADYIRLQNVSVQYSLNPKIFKNTVLKGCGVFYSASNLLTFSPHFWKWLDPATTYGMATMSNYPSPTLHSFGLNVQF